MGKPHSKGRQTQSPESALPHDEPLLDAWSLVLHASAKHSQTLAVVDCGSSTRLLTYDQLMRRSCSLAACLLTKHGVQPGCRIAVLLRNRSEVLEVHFAAAALHAVIVNLNVSLQPPELRFILHDSQAEVLIADEELRPTLAKVLFPEGPGEAEAGAAASTEPLAVGVRLKLILWTTSAAAAAAAAAATGAMPPFFSLMYEGECIAQRHLTRRRRRHLHQYRRLQVLLG